MFSSNTDSLGYQSFKGVSWALVLGLHLGDIIKGLLLVLGPFLIPMFGLESWACTPIISNPIRIQAIQYAVTNTIGNSTGGVLFTDKISIPYSKQTLSCATNFIWRLFQQNTPAQRKTVTKVTPIIENMDGVAYASNNQIHFSANYIGKYSGDVEREFTGVLYHEMTHIWQ